MRETGKSGFQKYLVEKLKVMFPGCMILKNDPNWIQGIPDLTIIYGSKWAILECKGYEGAPIQPNQPYYVELLNNMGFSSFIFPENEIEVLDRLHYHFTT